MAGLNSFRKQSNTRVRVSDKESCCFGVNNGMSQDAFIIVQYLHGRSDLRGLPSVRTKSEESR